MVRSSLVAHLCPLLVEVPLPTLATSLRGENALAWASQVSLDPSGGQGKREGSFGGGGCGSGVRVFSCCLPSEATTAQRDSTKKMGVSVQNLVHWGGGPKVS